MYPKSVSSYPNLMIPGAVSIKRPQIRRATGTRRVRTSATDPPFLHSCSLRVLDSSPGVQLGHLQVSLGGGPGGQTTFRQTVEYDFEAFQKSIPNLIATLIDLWNQKACKIKSKIHQKSIPKSMLFSIPFSDRCLIDFRSLQTLKMLIFHCRGAHFHEISVSRKISQIDKLSIQKASQNQSTIDRK